MGLPGVKVYRAFEELDALTDSECGSVINRAEINHPTLLLRVPWVCMIAAGVVWPLAWVAAEWLLPLNKYIPLLPSTLGGRVVLLVVSTVVVAALVLLVAQDACLYVGLRRELRRCHCPKCRQPLVGLPIKSTGDDNDPAKRYVRCPECGRRHNLLDMGLTPRDLIPYEQRVVAKDTAAFRAPRAQW
jgi:hypothetical protein